MTPFTEAGRQNCVVWFRDTKRYRKISRWCKFSIFLGILEEQQKGILFYFDLFQWKLTFDAVRCGNGSERGMEQCDAFDRIKNQGYWCFGWNSDFHHETCVHVFDHPRKLHNLLIHPKRENICGFCFLASEKFAENVRTSWRPIAQQKYIIFLVDNIAYLSKKYHFVCTIWRNWAMSTLHTVQNWWFLRSSPKFFWKSNMIRGFWIPAKPVFWMYESIL